MATCNPSTLLAAAKDFIPLSKKELLAVTAQLLCELKSVPHAMLSSTSDLTCPVPATFYPVTYTNIEEITEIGYTVGDSKIYVQRSGSYLMAVSAITDTQGPAVATIDFWASVNGVAVPRSDTRVSLQGNTIETTLAVTFLYNFAAGDYLEFFYKGSTVNVRLHATAAGGGIPASPSIIVTINRLGV